MTDTHARAFWVTAPGQGTIRAERLAEPGSDEIQVRTLYSAISRGTESLVFNGRVPSSEYTRMRAPFQAGEFPWPVKYGYMNVGIVERGPADTLGSTVHCLFPHQTRYVVPADAVHRLPENVPAERAVLAANAETAVNGLWDASPTPGAAITVIGAGTVGCLIARFAKTLYDADVELLDIDSSRAPIAERLGVSFAHPANASTDRAVIFHTSGAPAGLVTALAIAGFEATIIELSWYGDRIVGLPLGEAFHSRRLTIRSSQVGAIAPSRRGSISFRSRMELAISQLADPSLDALFGTDGEFESLPAIMKNLSNGGASAPCNRIAYAKG